MNKLDKDYQSLLQDILDNGVEKKDRTNTGTISVFGRQIRHKMSDGFPLLTTKKMAFKTMVTELLWFLKGDTNIKYLVNNGCNIWNGDAYKNYYNAYPNAEKSFQYEGSTIETRRMTQDEFIDMIKTDDEFAKKWGELGPIYGHQWRTWTTWTSNDLEDIDQIANLINNLKTNPDSRRLMVNAWNVGELDQMTLPPCHFSFQCYTRELSARERTALGSKGSTRLYDSIKEENYKTIDADTEMHKVCDEVGVPKRAISLMWNQRSVDTFLGLPFNIASYGLLLEIIAKEVNMVPDELIGNLGDVHLYSNHVEQAKEQIGRELTIEERVGLIPEGVLSQESVEYFNLNKRINTEIMVALAKYFIRPNLHTREPYPLPTLKIEDGFDIVSGLDDIYEINSFTLENYQSHPTIKAPLSN